MDSPYEKLQGYRDRGLLDERQLDALSRYEKRKKYGQIKELADAGKLSPEQMERFGGINPEAFGKVRTGGHAFGRGALKEATLSAADEIGGFVKGVFSSDTIGDATDKIRAGDALAELEHPDAFIGGQVAGGVASTAIPGAPVLRAAATGGKMLPRIAASIGLGGATEGVRAFNAGEGGAESRTEQVPFGATVGGVGGAAAVPIGAIAGNIGARMRGIVRGSGVPGKNNETVDELLNAFDRDERGAIGRLDPQDAATTDLEALRFGRQRYADVGEHIRSEAGQLAKFGDEAVPADIGGEIQTLAEGATRQGHTFNPVLARITRNRAHGKQGRIDETFETNIGEIAEASKLRDDLVLGKKDLGQGYETLFDTNTDPLSVESLYNSLGEASSQSGRITRGVIDKHRKDLEPFLKSGIPPRTLHNMLTDLSTEIDHLKASNYGPQAAQVLKQVEGYHNILNKVPGYAKLRSSYGKLSDMEGALDAGTQALSANKDRLSPAKLAQQYEEYSPEQRTAFIAGIREALDKTAGTTAGAEDMASRAARNKWNRETLSTVFGPDKGEEIATKLAREETFDTVNTAIQTAAKQSSTHDVNARLRSLNSKRLASGGNILGRVREKIKPSSRRPGGLLGPGPVDAPRSREDRLTDQILDFMSAQGGDRDTLLEALAREAERRSKPSITEELMRAIAETGTRSLATTGNIR